mmetsp:Transcript_53601/g.61439  ORF Transcript_53601/g.61439 Transcript_53601/m.61439 type:complete len:528 (+) Transcript_53601:142-1725(+)
MSDNQTTERIRTKIIDMTPTWSAKGSISSDSTRASPKKKKKSNVKKRAVQRPTITVKPADPVAKSRPKFLVKSGSQPEFFEGEDEVFADLRAILSQYKDKNAEQWGSTTLEDEFKVTKKDNYEGLPSPHKEFLRGVRPKSKTSAMGKFNAASIHQKRSIKSDLKPRKVRKQESLPLTPKLNSPKLTLNRAQRSSRRSQTTKQPSITPSPLKTPLILTEENPPRTQQPSRLWDDLVDKLSDFEFEKTTKNGQTAMNDVTGTHSLTGSPKKVTLKRNSSLPEAVFIAKNGSRRGSENKLLMTAALGGGALTPRGIIQEIENENFIGDMPALSGRRGSRRNNSGGVRVKKILSPLSGGHESKRRRTLSVELPKVLINSPRLTGEDEIKYDGTPQALKALSERAKEEAKMIRTESSLLSEMRKRHRSVDYSQMYMNKLKGKMFVFDFWSSKEKKKAIDVMIHQKCERELEEYRQACAEESLVRKQNERIHDNLFHEFGQNRRHSHLKPGAKIQDSINSFFEPQLSGSKTAR